jgi:hypothetical protein
MVNRALHGEQVIAARITPAITGIFALCAPRPAGLEIRDDSNFMKIFEPFDSSLNQIQRANPTPFSSLAVSLAAGNKTSRDVTGAGEKKTGQIENVFPYQSNILDVRRAGAAPDVRRKR